MKVRALVLSYILFLVSPLIYAQEKEGVLSAGYAETKDPGVITVVEYNTTLDVEKLIQTPQKQAPMRAEEFYVVFRLDKIVPPKKKKVFYTLTMTVRDLMNDTFIAEQKQFSDSLENLNDMMANFSHPRSGKAYVIGLKSTYCRKRLNGEKH